MATTRMISVLGLGYVGLPLAIALARRYPVIGFDISSARVAELKAGTDRTREVPDAILQASPLALSDQAADLAAADIHIVTVPTPVTADHQPDLKAVESACETVGQALAARQARHGSSNGGGDSNGGGGPETAPVVVFESTVYPGVTEDICGPALERASGLVCGRDFFLGYSPERMNPGDREHTVERITKVVAGQTEAVAALLAEIYGSINNGNIFIARSIATAEAAKVIENAQRDINIAFINEIAKLTMRLGLSVFDVLEAAETKWNFLPFRPGLVGGHCIGVDPYYLAHCAEAQGLHPQVILAGRQTNDGMAADIASIIDRMLALPDGSKGRRLLVLGLTFKENVPDLRNTKVADLIASFQAAGYQVDVHDPHADRQEALDYYGLTLLPDLEAAKEKEYDGVIGAVAHAEFKGLTADALAALVGDGGLIADIKGMWRHLPSVAGRRYWTL